MAAESVLHVRRWLHARRRPVSPGLAQQFFNDPAVDIAAVIAPHVDDQAFAVDVGVKIARERGDVIGAHGAQMQVADASLRGGSHLLGAAQFPVSIAQRRLFRHVDGRDDDGARRALAPFDLQQHLLVCLVQQQVADVARGQHVLAVDGRDHVAHLHIDFGARQRCARRRQFRFAAVDMLDSIALAGARQHGAQARRRAFLLRAAQFAGADLRMQGAHFGHHHAQHVIELGAVRDPFDQRRIFVARRLPVHAPHLRVIQEVAVQAPGIVEHLLPFQARIRHKRPVVNLDLGFRQVGRQLGARLDHQHLARAGGCRAGCCPVVQMLFILRQVEFAHIGHQQFRLGAGIANGKRLQAGLVLAAVALKEIQAFVVRGERAVVARRQRHFIQTLGQALADDGRQGGRRLFHGRLAAGLFQCLFRCLFGRLFIVRLGRLDARTAQLIVGLERKAVARLQCQRIHADALVEHGSHVAVAPR
ncbi:hypothetical protein D3C72_995230 [compost metagenome]